MKTPTPILRLENVTVSVNQGLKEQKDILKNLSLDVYPGDFITLLGTNGAGKSTLLNVINGKQTPTTGKIFILQKDVTHLSQAKRAKLIAQVFQDPTAATAPRMTVAENLLLATQRGQKRGLRLRHLKQALPTFEKLTAQVPNKLSQNLNNFVSNLSGGQRQTLSFLMATLTDPCLLLLDEHTAALDPKTSHQLMQLTAQTIQTKKLTCLMITHQLKDALAYGNRTIILKDGEIALDVSDSKKSALTQNEILKYFED